MVLILRMSRNSDTDTLLLDIIHNYFDGDAQLLQRLDVPQLPPLLRLQYLDVVTPLQHEPYVLLLDNGLCHSQDDSNFQFCSLEF